MVHCLANEKKKLFKKKEKYRKLEMNTNTGKKRDRLIANVSIIKFIQLANFEANTYDL